LRKKVNIPKKEINIDLNIVKQLKDKGFTYGHIAKYFNCCRRYLFKYLKENNYKYEKVKKDIFSHIDTEEKAYWLGFLYADGYLNKLNGQIELALQKDDEDHLYKFIKFLQLKKTPKDRLIKLNDREYKSVRVSFANEQIYNDLIKLGCVPAKSLILNFPSDDIVPPHLKCHFMRGYIDGDGWLVQTTNYYCLGFAGTKDFVNECCNYFNLKTNKLGTTGQAFTWRCSDKKLVKQYLSIFYNNANIFLDRKYKKYLEMIAV
jgi:hypothetical protein